MIARQTVGHWRPLSFNEIERGSHQRFLSKRVKSFELHFKKTLLSSVVENRPEGSKSGHCIEKYR